MGKDEDAPRAKPSALERVAAFIVDKRKAFYLIYIGLAIFCVFSSGWVRVNNELTDYLSEDTETRRGLTLMEEQVVTYGSNRILVDNLPYAQALELAERLEAVPGVKSVEFDGSGDHYRTGAALFTVTYEDVTGSDVSLGALERIRGELSGFDTYVTGSNGNSESDQLAAEMGTVKLIVVIIILLVLLFTSQTYMEIPVLLITFGMGALLNMGTNFFFDEISFVSDSVAVVLQLALAIDYAIILCHRYTEERERHGAREAVVIALSKAIPEIAGSSLTTLSGLGAMCFMKFGIGLDLGLVLMKSILLSLLSVFTLMPGLLMSFSGLIDRTHHRNFVPKITAVGRFAVKTRFVIPPIFAVALVGAFVFSNRCPYVYGSNTLTTIHQNENQIARQKVEGLFGRENQLAVMVPAGDYEREGRLTRALERLDGVESVLALSGVEAVDGYMLTDRLTPRQFAELAGLDVEVARLLYSAYAVEQGTYGRLVSGLDNFGVPLLDMFLFVYDQMQEGYISLDAELAERITELHDGLIDAKKQLLGEGYSRLVLNLSLPEEGEETFAFLDAVHSVADPLYPGQVLLVGNSTSDRDLASSFGKDNLMISILTIVFVILVLIFTFQSAGLPVLLILVIQGSVWINFSFPYLQGSSIFFLSYLVVSSIQMGANIDYAIVIANRYTELKQVMDPKEAVVEALNECFPTIVTSGTILASAGVLIGLLSSTPSVASIGICLGRGTVISIFLVLCILPQILLLGDTIIEKTAFTIKARLPLESHNGTVALNGHVRGYISGVVDARIDGVLRGSINAVVSGGKAEGLEETALPAGKETADEAH